MPLAFDLTGGEAGDNGHFPILVGIGPDITPRAVVCHKGHDRTANRQFARQHGMVPVIPQTRTAKIPQRRFTKALYRARGRIEQAVGKLNRS